MSLFPIFLILKLIKNNKNKNPRLYNFVLNLISVRGSRTILNEYKKNCHMKIEFLIYYSIYTSTN